MKLPGPVRHAIFDLDGVLLDTEVLYTQATAAVAARYGKVYDWSVKRLVIGRGTMDAARRIIDALALPLDPLTLIAERDVILHELFRSARSMPGAERFTRALAARGVPMAVATSTEAPLFAEKARPHQEWLSVFSAIVCGDDPRVARSKPAPDIFLAAAAALGAAPETCVVFEDSPAGVEGALAAGMQVVALPDPAVDVALVAGAHRIVPGFADLSPDELGF